MDTLLTGDYAFSGTDTTWKDIWMCLPSSVAVLTDSMLVRFTLKSDSVDSNKEGWLIDNIILHPTFMHTASKILKETDVLDVYPTVTSGVVYIGTKRSRKLNNIEKIQLINAAGQIVHEYGNSQVNTSIDISDFADGMYLLKIKTNLRTNTFKIILKK